MRKLHLIAISILLSSIGLSQEFSDSKAIKKQRKRFLKVAPYAYIPSGTLMVGQTDGDVYNFNANRARTCNIKSFYMMKYEVSNIDYLTYVQEIRKTDTLLAKSIYPDTLVWRTGNGFNQAYEEYYLRHPAYRDYPLVGISYNDAVAFAKWLTAEYDKRIDKEFKKVKFRLPTEEEWEYAARGGDPSAIYPWSHYSARNEDGDCMANFLYFSQHSIYRDSSWGSRIVIAKDHNSTMDSIKRPYYRLVNLGMSPGNYMGVAGSLNDNADVTAPVGAYWPNAYGLYNMAGNVEEMVDAYYDRDPFSDELHDLMPSRAEDPSGITRGGSWDDPGYNVTVSARQFYSGKEYSSREMGFRLVMEVIDY